MLNRPSRTLTRCLVCGSSEIRTDEVIDHGVVLLAECPRCAHRWTHSAGPAGAQARARLRRAGPAAKGAAA
jgi:hypothetical protein